MNDALGWTEAVVDRAGIAEIVEELLPTAGRPRQLRVRTLLVGMLLTLADGRPAHLVRVHRALTGLAREHRWRLGIEIEWKTGPHLLTYRQVERTFGLLTEALDPDALARVVDALVEASVPDQHQDASNSYAADWTDLESWGRPPNDGEVGTDPDASWGHRSANGAGMSTMFYGYYLQAITMVRDENGPPVPELVRRIALAPCSQDPPRHLVPTIARMIASGIPVDDVLADSGYAHRAADAWALPLRKLGTQLVQDLHPHDRGPKGTHAGAIAANGNLYCPATPPALLRLSPAPPQTTTEVVAALDAKTAEAARYKLGRISAHDTDGYHRVCCPAVADKLRCPLQPESMSLDFDRPEILAPPEHPPRCCEQQTITVPPEVNAKTAQKHDYPSAAWRRSYTRRTGSERSFSTVKDPATTSIRRGWCRLTGTPALILFAACAFVVRNDRIVATFEARRAEDSRGAAKGTPPRTRRRHRRTTDDLVATPP
jgi:hypothetical protein